MHRAALRTQTAVDLCIIARDDLDRAVANDDLARALQAFAVDGRGESRRVVTVGRIPRTDKHVLAGEPDGIDRVDPATNADIALRRQRNGPREQIVDRPLADLAVAADHTVNEFAGRRANVQ